MTAFTLAAPDGASLHVKVSLPPGDQTVLASVVMVHGFSVHSGLYVDVATHLASRGLAVTMFDCRGHGESSGARGFVNRFSLFCDDLHAVLEDARRRHPGVPTVLLAHSHGAVVALDYLLSRQPGGGGISALMLAAPWMELTMKVPAFKLVLARLLDRLWPTLALPNELRPDDGTRNPTLREALRNDPHVHHLATSRWFMEVRRAQTRIRRRISQLRLPLFMVLAGDDRVVSTKAALTLAGDAARHTDVEVKLYGDLFHELYLEPEGEKVLDDLVAWLKRTLARARAGAVAGPSGRADERLPT